MSIALLGLTIAGVGVSTTFAGYQKETEVAQQVGLQRYLFLDVTSWKGDNPDFYVYLFTMKNSSNESGKSSLEDSDYLSPEAKQWYKGSYVAGSSNNVCWFYVPTRYEWAVFVRARGGAPLADVQAWKKSSDESGPEAVWNQTGDISISGSANLFIPSAGNFGVVSSSSYSLPNPS